MKSKERNDKSCALGGQLGKVRSAGGNCFLCSQTRLKAGIANAQASRELRQCKVECGAPKPPLCSPLRLHYLQ